MKNKREKLIIYVILILGGVFIVTPFLWMALSALNTPKEIVSYPKRIIPKTVTLNNFKEIFALNNFKNYFINSVLVTFSITIGEVITTVMAAFAFAKLEFKGKNILFYMLIGTMMVPSEILIIPNFVFLSNIQWINSYKALIIPWCTSVFSIFLLRQHFLRVPKELYYAAKIDGCNDFKFLIRILIPIVRPAIVTVLIMKAINSWNAFMWPMVMTNSESMRTLPTALAKFSSEVGSDYHLIMAMASLIIIPIIILYLLLQKYIISGVGGSGVKG